MNMLKRKIEASADGLQLAMLISEPAGEPKGIVQIVHGCLLYTSDAADE